MRSLDGATPKTQNSQCSLFRPKRETKAPFSVAYQNLTGRVW